MTREELRTLAALDVFGLLDEYESNLYTRSFHHASAGVQDELLELQAKIAAHPPLLPREAPSADLRDKVMRAVSNAMDNESRKFAPIASIGRHRSRMQDVPGRPLPARGTYIWRAAAFVLAGALVAVLYFFADTVQRTQELAQLAYSGWTAEQAEALLGPDFRSFVDNPNCEHVMLTPPDGAAPNAYAVMSLNQATEQAFLFTAGLPQLDDDEQYVLRVKHNDGTFEELKRFSPQTIVSGLRLDRVATALLSSSAIQWQVATLDGSRVLLQSA